MKLAQTELRTKSIDFFKGIAEASQAEQQMKIGWQLTDSKNSKVNRERKDTRQRHRIVAHQLLKGSGAGKTRRRADRERKGRVRENQSATKASAGEISKLEKSAQKDKAVAKALSEIQKQAERIIGQPATLDAYIATLYLLEGQIGLIRGYEYYVDKLLRADYVGRSD